MTHSLSWRLPIIIYHSGSTLELPSGPGGKRQTYIKYKLSRVGSMRRRGGWLGAPAGGSRKVAQWAATAIASM
eukprot:6187695-Pleurochrysis_carterae.AAC.1